MVSEGARPWGRGVDPETVILRVASRLACAVV